MGLEIRAGSQRYLLGIWIAMGVLTPLIGFLGARGFAPGVGLMGALCLPLVRPGKADWLPLGLLAALIVWILIGMIWSPAPNLAVHSFKDFERLTPLHMIYQLVLSGAFVLAAVKLDEERAEEAMRWLGYGLLALAAILVVEGLSKATIYQHMQGIVTPTVTQDIAVRNVAVGGYVVAALLWPAGVALQRRGRNLLVLVLLASVVFSTVFLRGDSPSLAIVVGGAAFVAVLKFGRPAILGLMTVWTTYWLITPWVVLGLEKAGVWSQVYGHLPASWDRRMEIWSFTTERILESPLRGWGVDASRTFKGYIQLHPHDGALQAWFELGLPGAILISAFFGLLFWRISRVAEERVFAATACATATVYLTIGAISFSLWQEWWLCLGAFALAACLVLRSSLKMKPVVWSGEGPSKAG
jgi:O-antigen ligase